MEYALYLLSCNGVPPLLHTFPNTTLFRSWGRPGTCPRRSRPRRPGRRESRRRIPWPPETFRSDSTERVAGRTRRLPVDRKSTRLNSSHGYNSYAVFCLKKKKYIKHSINIL